jgi:6-pyruvoyltetrahydropterin/6-carboxytetrahydropterin synthase
VTAHYLLSAEAAFAAAHTLPGVEKCERMHGHNWRVRLTVQVDESALDAGGMAVDFRVIESALQDAVGEFDHSYLNELEPFRQTPPTAECIARVVCERSAARLGEGAPAAAITSVEVWETPHYRVEYRPA